MADLASVKVLDELAVYLHKLSVRAGLGLLWSPPALFLLQDEESMALACELTVILPLPPPPPPEAAFNMLA